MYSSSRDDRNAPDLPLHLIHGQRSFDTTSGYHITATSQCMSPDAVLGGVLNVVSFDAVYVQFCEVVHGFAPLG